MSVAGPVEIAGVTGVPDYRVTQLSSPSHRYALVIPVLNEGERITAQLARIRQVAPSVDVVIADGNSSDGSTEPTRLAELGVTTLLVKTGPGKLSAQLRMAIHHVLAAGYEGVITMDGNGKDGVDGIGGFVEALNQGYDFIQGSRFVTGGAARNTPVSRYLAIRGFHAPVTSLGAKHLYTDTTNGFRGHSRRLLADTRVDPLRDVFQTYELLAYLPIRAARLGFRVTEVPVERSYPKNEATPTKIHGASGHLGLIRIVMKAALGHYAPE